MPIGQVLRYLIAAFAHNTHGMKKRILPSRHSGCVQSPLPPPIHQLRIAHNRLGNPQRALIIRRLNDFWDNPAGVAEVESVASTEAILAKIELLLRACAPRFMRCSRIALYRQKAA